MPSSLYKHLLQFCPCVIILSNEQLSSFSLFSSPPTHDTLIIWQNYRRWLGDTWRNYGCHTLSIKCSHLAIAKRVSRTNSYDAGWSNFWWSLSKWWHHSILDMACQLLQNMTSGHIKVKKGTGLVFSSQASERAPESLIWKYSAVVKNSNVQLSTY